MKTIVIYTSGTLADHLPFIALGQALSARGYRVQMVINQAMHPYAHRAGLEAIALTEVKHDPANSQDTSKWYAMQARQLIDLCRDADLLISTSTSILGYLTYNALMLPWLTASINPYTFRQTSSPQKQDLQQQPGIREYNQRFKELLPLIFAELGLNQVLPQIRMGWHWARHILLASSPHFSQHNLDILQPFSSIDMTGFWFYEDSDWQKWQPEDTLRQFCQRQPIVLTFGNHHLKNLHLVLALHVEAASQNQARPLVIQQGSTGLSEDDLPSGAYRKEIMFINHTPHGWLFAQAACAIQHGGIGLMARALRQGCPLLVEPHNNDQLYNANQVIKLGLGTVMNPSQMTAGSLMQALNEQVLSADCRNCADAFAAKIQTENGLETACQYIEKYLARLAPNGQHPPPYSRYAPPLTPRHLRQTFPNYVQDKQVTDHTLILFFNTMWGQPFNIDGLQLPDGCELTTDRHRFREATAVVFHAPDVTGTEGFKKLPGQIWIVWSMECEVHYPYLQDPEFMKLFDLTMTYHLDADIPVTYIPHYNHEIDNTFRITPHPKTKDNLAALFLSSSFNQSDRIKYATKLMQYLDIHSYGRYLKNRDIKDDKGRATKLEIIANYKFTLCFENAIAKDYVTEKFFDPLLAGSVPVYLGAPNVNEFAPGDHCFINITDFQTPEELAEYLLALNKDDTAYEEYHTWRQKPLRANFIRLLNEQREPAFVRLCGKVQELRSSRDIRRFAHKTVVTGNK